MTTLVKPVLKDIVLQAGGHSSREDGVCVMELAAWLAGREHTARPPCVSPAIAGFLMSWNDSLDEKSRQKLKPYARKVLNTATNADDERTRGWLATNPSKEADMTKVEQIQEIWVAPEAPVVTPAGPREVLHRAADLLESGEWEWCQGGARDGDGLCMLGAVAAAVGDVPRGTSIGTTHPLYEAAAKRLRALDGGWGGARFNDAPGRTRAEVVARLREAAEASHE